MFKESRLFTGGAGYGSRTRLSGLGSQRTTDVLTLQIRFYSELEILQIELLGIERTLARRLAPERIVIEIGAFAGGIKTFVQRAFLGIVGRSVDAPAAVRSDMVAEKTNLLSLRHTFTPFFGRSEVCIMSISYFFRDFHPIFESCQKTLCKFFFIKF